MDDEALLLLHFQPELRQTLEFYADAAAANQQPDRDWFDRCDRPDRLADSRAHGTLLAKGWLETRVGLNFLLPDGRLADCYRLSRTGRKLVERLRHPFQEVTTDPFAFDPGEGCDPSDAPDTGEGCDPGEGLNAASGHGEGEPAHVAESRVAADPAEDRGHE